VTYVFMVLFGYSKEKQTEQMLKVNIEGRAKFSGGTREGLERVVQRLHEYGLWATLQRDNEY